MVTLLSHLTLSATFEGAPHGQPQRKAQDLPQDTRREEVAEEVPCQVLILSALWSPCTAPQDSEVSHALWSPELGVDGVGLSCLNR